MKVVSCLNIVNNTLLRCPKTMAPYRPLFSTNIAAIRHLMYVRPQADILGVRADKVLASSFYDKSIALRDVKALCEEAIPSQKKQDAVLSRYLSKYIANDNNPDRPIREIKGRIKSSDSVMEKIQALIQNSPELAAKMETKAGIKEEITDLVGNKVILRSDDKNETAIIIEELFKAHKCGELKITEVEVYYPTLRGKEEDFIQFMQTQYGKKVSLDDCKKIIGDQDYFSYVVKNEIDKIAEKYGIKVKYPPRNTGYTAIHIGTASSDGFKGEIQIVGCNVENLANIQHQYYKAQCGKTIIPELRTSLAPLMPQTANPEIQSLTQDYTFFAFIFERLKAKIHYKQKVDTEFLRAPQKLRDLQLGFNQNASIIRGHLKKDNKTYGKRYTIPQ